MPVTTAPTRTGVVGIDLGTTATKVVAVDAAHRPVSTVQRATPLLSTPDGAAVHDPEAVLAAVIETVRETAEACTQGDAQ